MRISGWSISRWSESNAREGGQECNVAHQQRLTIAATRTANYAALRWQPVMRHVRRLTALIFTLNRKER
jgi:hypothetical protein